MSVAQIFAWVYFVLYMCRLLSKFLWISLASAWEGLELSVPTSTRVSGCVVFDVLCGSPSLDFCYSIWKSKNLLALGRLWICLGSILAVLYFFLLSNGIDTSHSQMVVYSKHPKTGFTCKASRIKHLTWSFAWYFLTWPVAPLHRCTRHCAPRHSWRVLATLRQVWSPQLEQHRAMVLTLFGQIDHKPWNMTWAIFGQRMHKTSCVVVVVVVVVVLSHIALRMPSWIATPRWRLSTEGRGTEMHRGIFLIFGSAVN